MKGVGTDIGIIHFVGIGGIGMSGIAEVMRNLGYTVQGSDIAEGASVERLRTRGITVHIGHAKENVEGVAVVVTSTAVRRTNPEVAAALAKLAGFIAIACICLASSLGWNASCRIIRAPPALTISRVLTA